MIHVFWPTLRPQMAADRARLWIERSRDKFASSNYNFVFCVEPSSDAKPLQKLLTEFSRVHIITSKSPHTGVCYPATKLIRGFVIDDSDVVVLASDDFEPSAERVWDSAIKTFFEDNKEGCLLDDGYKIQTNIVPLPIISGRLLRKLNNIIYNPVYRHFYSDQELHDILSEMHEIGERRNSTTPMFVHRHHTFGGRARDGFDAKNQDNFKTDKATYESRRKLPLAEKLKTPGWFK